MQEGRFETILGGLYLRFATGAARKRIFALRAQKEKKASMALLFVALAESDEAQARRILFLLRGIIDETTENVAEILERELPRLRELYRQLGDEGRRQGMVSLRHLAAQEERVGRKNSFLLQKTAERKGEASAYYVCSFCGYVHEKEAPEQCPVCQAPRKRFRRVS